MFSFSLANGLKIVFNVLQIEGILKNFNSNLYVFWTYIQHRLHIAYVYQNPIICAYSNVKLCWFIFIIFTIFHLLVVHSIKFKLVYIHFMHFLEVSIYCATALPTEHLCRVKERWRRLSALGMDSRILRLQVGSDSTHHLVAFGHFGLCLQ